MGHQTNTELRQRADIVLAQRVYKPFFFAGSAAIKVALHQVNLEHQLQG
jgi:hypothetical protein